MARRRSRRKTARRRRSTGINLLNAAEMYLSSAVLTQNFAGTNPLSFLTGIEYGQTGITSGGVKGGRPVMGYGYMPMAASVTIPELMGAGTANLGDGIETIKENFKANWVNAAIGTIGVKVGFKIAKRITSKQRSFINNKILKPLDLKRMVTV